jgi:hypothetical protein
VSEDCGEVLGVPAGAFSPTRTIFASRSREHWGAKSAMSSRSRFVVCIIGSFPGRGDEAAWWTCLKIDPVPNAFALWRSTHHYGAFTGPAGGGTQSTVETSKPASLIDFASQ